MKNPNKYLAVINVFLKPVYLLTSVLAFVKLPGPLDECHVLAVGKISFSTLID